MKPWEIYPVSLELQTILLCMDMMTVIMIRMSVLSCNRTMRLAFVVQVQVCLFKCASSSVPRKLTDISRDGSVFEPFHS